jgi:hypothetical protein
LFSLPLPHPPLLLVRPSIFLAVDVLRVPLLRRTDPGMPWMPPPPALAPSAVAPCRTDTRDLETPPRLFVCLSVCLSVCLRVKWVRAYHSAAPKGDVVIDLHLHLDFYLCTFQQFLNKSYNLPPNLNDYAMLRDLPGVHR